METVLLEYLDLALDTRSWISLYNSLAGPALRVGRVGSCLGPQGSGGPQSFKIRAPDLKKGSLHKTS